jgi:hypothetical protein
MDNFLPSELGLCLTRELLQKGFAFRARGLEECGSLVSHNLSVSKHIGFEVLSAYSAHVCHPDLLREGGFIQFIPKEGLPRLWRVTSRGVV